MLSRIKRYAEDLLDEYVAGRQAQKDLPRFKLEEPDEILV